MPRPISRNRSCSPPGRVGVQISPRAALIDLLNVHGRPFEVGGRVVLNDVEDLIGFDSVTVRSDLQDRNVVDASLLTAHAFGPMLALSASPAS